MHPFGVKDVAPPSLGGPDLAQAAIVVRDPVRLCRSHALLGISYPPSLRRAVDTRRAEYISGRVCAARALEQLGLPAELSVDRAPDGRPLWPAGVVGSITHSAGYARAAVARAQSITSIGIDTETVMSDAVRAEVRGEILTDGDRRLLGSVAVSTGFAPGVLVTLVFSAKESLIKCLYPIHEAAPTFSEVDVAQIDREAGTLLLRTRREAFPADGGRAYEVPFAISPPFVHTTIVLRKGNE